MTPEQFLEYLLSLPEDARLQTIDSMRGAMDSGSVSDETYGLMAELLSGVNAVSAFPEAQGEQRTDADFFDYIMQVANNFGAGPNAMMGRKPGDEGFDPHLSMAEALAEKGMPWGLAGVAGTVYDFVEPGLGEWGRAATAIGSAALPIARSLRELPSELSKMLSRITGADMEIVLDLSPSEAKEVLRQYSRNPDVRDDQLADARRMLSRAEGIPEEEIYPGGGGLLEWMDDIAKSYEVDHETLEYFAATDFEGTLRDIKQMYPEAKDWQVAELFSEWITEASMRGAIPPERYQELVDEVIPKVLGGRNFRTIDLDDFR